MEFEGKVEMFKLVLGEYSYRQIRDGFVQYLKRNPDMPAPSDICNIIDPEPEPLSGAVYIQIKKQLRDGNVFVSDRERAYCEAYEKQEMNKVRGGSVELRNAQAQIQAHSVKLLSSDDGYGDE